MNPSTLTAAPARPSVTVRVLVTIFFIGLLAIPYFVRRYSPEQQSTSAMIDHVAALARYGFYLQEVSHAAGIDFVHEAPVLDSKLAHIMPEVASMGASVTVVDFDRDGWPDLYVNMHDGTFKDVATELGVADVNQAGTGVSMGAVWGDYDNDGYEDLFLIKWGKPELFHNDEGKGFHRVSV